MCPAKLEIRDILQLCLKYFDSCPTVPVPIRFIDCLPADPSDWVTTPDQADWPLFFFPAQCNQDKTQDTMQSRQCVKKLVRAGLESNFVSQNNLRPQGFGQNERLVYSSFRSICSLFLAVQNSSIGDLVTQSLTQSVTVLLLFT